MIPAGMPESYVKYMMGQTPDTYNDIQSKGIEFLREIYERAALSIQPKSQYSRLEKATEFLRGIGIDPEKALIRDAFAEPHRFDATATPDKEGQRTRILLETLRDRLERKLSES